MSNQMTTPIRPEFIETARLIWTANGTRNAAATETRKNVVLRQIDSIKADNQRRDNALQNLHQRGLLADFLAWHSAQEAIVDR